jgi:hypothetical protein
MIYSICYSINYFFQNNIIINYEQPGRSGNTHINEIPETGYIRHVQTIYINIYSKYIQDIIGKLQHNYDNNKYF